MGVSQSFEQACANYEQFILLGKPGFPTAFGSFVIAGSTKQFIYPAYTNTFTGQGVKGETIDRTPDKDTGEFRFEFPVPFISSIHNIEFQITGPGGNGGPGTYHDIFFPADGGGGGASGCITDKITTAVTPGDRIQLGFKQEVSIDLPLRYTIIRIFRPDGGLRHDEAAAGGRDGAAGTNGGEGGEANPCAIRNNAGKNHNAGIGGLGGASQFNCTSLGFGAGGGGGHAISDSRKSGPTPFIVGGQGAIVFRFL